LVSDAPTGVFRAIPARCETGGAAGKDMEKLKRALSCLIEETPLPAVSGDHPLRGAWRGWRDLNIEPDWVLIYRVDDDSVCFERTGQHVDLFGD
jgi:mRNA interferase YafQ